MKHSPRIGLFCLCILSFLTTQPLHALAAEPVKLIFDTDMGNDIDDALALGVIHALQNRGECELLAVTVSKDNASAARYCDQVNTFYGRGNIPVGRVRNGKTPKDGQFLKQVIQANFPHDLTGEADTPEAYKLLRKILAGQPDNSVVLVVVGFSTNMARLVESSPDEFSPLSGKELVKKKVKLLSMMGGHFGDPRPPEFKEYNIKIDLEAAGKVFAQWPTPIVISGFEIGLSIRYPYESILKDYNYVPRHPLKEGYLAWSKNKPHDRPTWDLTSVLYAVRPERGYFGISNPGALSISTGGYAAYATDSHGRHRFLTATPEQITRVREALVMLSSEPPKQKTQSKERARE